MVCNELNSRMPLQQEIRFYIPLELTCCLFVAYCHEFLNMESYDGFVLTVERDLLFDYYSREGASRICLIYEVVCCHKDEDCEEYARTYYETLNQTSLTQNYQGSPPNTFYILEAYDTH